MADMTINIEEVKRTVEAHAFDSDYDYQRNTWGLYVYYEFYNDGEFMGVYKIKPGEYGGSIKVPEVRERYQEWFNFCDNIWRDLGIVN